MQYPKAVVCLRHIVTLNEDDRTGNLLLLLWLCYMGEWEVVKYQLKTQLKLSESTSKHYSLIIQVITEAVALNIGNNEVCFIYLFSKIHIVLQNSIFLQPFCRLFSFIHLSILIWKNEI